jgi:hypothetical protein
VRIRSLRFQGLIAASVWLAIALGYEGAALAANATDPATNADIDVPARYRDGFTPSVSLRTGMAHVSGSPNDARAINNPDFHSSSDLLLGTSYSFHLGYALTDYLTTGFMVDVAQYESAHWRSHGLGVGIRIDAFPLYKACPCLANLGVFGEVGVGQATLDAKVGRYPNNDGTQSYVGTGLFYELTLTRIKTGHLALAPEIKYAHVDAMSISSDSLTTGLRLAFYLSK